MAAEAGLFPVAVWICEAFPLIARSTTLGFLFQVEWAEVSVVVSCCQLCSCGDL